VRTEVEALERLCADVERAMMSGRWDDLSVALAESRRVQHALQNAMHEAAGARDEAFDATVYAKLQWIFAIRENQMARLRHYQGSISERLQSIARAKSVARRVGVERTPSRLGTLNQLT
jgi:hypothetical protein